MADGGSWLRRYLPAPECDVRLVCLPHAGGSATFYHPVARALAPTIEVVAVQYPGRQDRRAEAGITDVRVLARHIADALRGWVDRPVALFGHSMGAMLAFELAVLLEGEIGVVPRALFASGRRAPSRHRHETVHLRDDHGLIAELRRLSGTNQQILADEELLEIVLPAIRADYTAAETYVYRPGPALRCPITALVGRDDPRVTVEEAQSWKEHTSGAFDLREFPGGHFYLTDHQEAVNAVIRERLTG